jgi:hypothetical protein
MRGTAMAVPVFTQWFFNASMVLVFPHYFLHYRETTFGLITIFCIWSVLLHLEICSGNKRQNPRGN